MVHEKEGALAFAVDERKVIKTENDTTRVKSHYDACRREWLIRWRQSSALNSNTWRNHFIPIRTSTLCTYASDTNQIIDVTAICSCFYRQPRSMLDTIFTSAVFSERRPDSDWTRTCQLHLNISGVDWKGSFILKGCDILVLWFSPV
jgi:hypothetical protein